MILDNEDGASRLLTFDGTEVTEWPGGDMYAMAIELAAHNPDLILVNRAGMPEQDDALVEELNRRAPFGYAWREAPGELPA